MDYKKSLEDLEDILIELKEENKFISIIVEGEKDIVALRKLGIKGKIVSLNKGINLSNFCDNFAREHTSVIILTDWDKRGGRICRLIKKNLQGRVICNIRYREFFAKNTTIKTVEGLPSWIETVKKKLDKNGFKKIV
jgi:5S rRNA maturation endonuclease (ribonuclease M5)